jgi:hypothetical protein
MTPNDFAVYCKSLDAWITNGVPESTALLVAAAPELLAALTGCITEPGAACWCNADNLPRRILAINEIARAAIAKAKVNGLAGKWEQSRTDGTTPHSTPTRNSRPQQTHNR